MVVTLLYQHLTTHLEVKLDSFLIRIFVHYQLNLIIIML